MNLNKNISNKFEEAGYLVVRNLFSRKEIKKILNEIKIVKSKISNQKNQYFHKTADGKINTIHNLQLIFKKNYFNKIAKCKKITKIVNLLLKDKSIPRNIEFFLKPNRTGLKAPYHQDNYYWNIENSKGLNVWIACSKSSIKNGGVIYLEGSQKLGTIEHEISYLPGSSQKINQSILNKLKFKKKCPDLNPGDCIFHHCEIIHGSKSNNSNSERIGLVISYKTTKSKYDKKKIRIYKNKLKENLNYLYN